MNKDSNFGWSELQDINILLAEQNLKLREALEFISKDLNIFGRPTLSAKRAKIALRNSRKLGYKNDGSRPPRTSKQDGK